MLGVVLLIFILHTLVGQVDHVVGSVDIKVSRACADVALLVNVDSEGISYQRPDPQVKLSISVTHRLLNILLYYPVSSHGARRIDTVCYLPEFIKYFNSFTLIGVCWLHQPQVLFTVFPWSAFLPTATFGQLGKPVHQMCNFTIV